MSWDPNEFSDEKVVQGASSVLNDLESEIQEEQESDQHTAETLSEAMKRIEEANLWKTLVSQDVFQPGSARAEIVNSINAKIKKFALNNLELCVGIRSESVQKPLVQEVKSPFDADETTALKILAAKVLKRDVATAVMQQTYTPQLAKVSTSDQLTNNGMNTVGQSQQAVKQTVKTQTKKPAQQVKQKPKLGSNYIPPAPNYIPQTQSSVTATADSNLPQGGMAGLISNLIQQASGGNILATNSSDTGMTDINERF